MDEPKTSGETRQVLVTHGEFAGRELQMPAAAAQQAISDGWAREPGSPPPKEGLSDEQNQRALEAAAKGVNKLRGVKDAPGEPIHTTETAKPLDKQMEAEDTSAGSYKTRATGKTTKS